MTAEVAEADTGAASTRNVDRRQILLYSQNGSHYCSMAVAVARIRDGHTSFAPAVSPACSIRSAASPIIVVSSGLARRTLWYNVTARNGSPALRAWSNRAWTAPISSGSSTCVVEVCGQRWQMANRDRSMVCGDELSRSGRCSSSRSTREIGPKSVSYLQ